MAFSASRTLLALLSCLLMLGGARAGTVTLVFDQASQSSSPGQVLKFFGTIYNTGADDVYVNSFSINFEGAPAVFMLTDLFTFPIIAAGENSGLVELFEYAVDGAFADVPGTFVGAYTLLGGADGDAGEVLGDAAAAFSITVQAQPSEVAEPNALALGLLSMGLLALSRRHGHRRALLEH